MEFPDYKVFDNIELSDKVIVSDPCYERGTWCAGELNILPGTYTPISRYVDQGEWGVRVKSIEVQHVDWVDSIGWEVTKLDVGVDSGQAGIFDNSIYPYGDNVGETDFYRIVCDLTSDSKIESHTLSKHFREQDLFINESMTELAVAAGDEEKLKYLKVQREHIEKQLQEWEPKFDPHANTVKGKGFVSLSGDGDGSYRCYVRKNSDGDIVGVKIDYYSDIDPDEEE